MEKESQLDLMVLYGLKGRSSAGSKVYHLHNETGTGTITIFDVFEGVRVAYNDIHMAYCDKKKEKNDSVIEINHCLEGRYECHIGSQSCCYMAPGDLAIGTVNKKVTKSSFPLSHYHGISIFIEKEKMSKELWTIITLLEINMNRIMSMASQKEWYYILRDSQSIDHIFSELYSIRECRKSSYLKVKVLELLLFLSDMEYTESVNMLTYINNKQVKLAKEVCEFITLDVKIHMTIEELAVQFHVSPTVLKQSFKSVYGSSIYAYLRNYRLQLAQRLLVETKDSIAVIASQVGYENPNKFSSAFKQAYDLAPTDYRKQYRSVKECHHDDIMRPFG